MTISSEHYFLKQDLLK